MLAIIIPDMGMQNARPSIITAPGFLNGFLNSQGKVRVVIFCFAGAIRGSHDDRKCRHLFWNFSN
jgi:hypothetical protein